MVQLRKNALSFSKSFFIIIYNCLWTKNIVFNFCPVGRGCQVMSSMCFRSRHQTQSKMAAINRIYDLPS